MANGQLAHSVVCGWNQPLSSSKTINKHSCYIVRFRIHGIISSKIFMTRQQTLKRILFWFWHLHIQTNQYLMLILHLSKGFFEHSCINCRVSKKRSAWLRWKIELLLSTQLKSSHLNAQSILLAPSDLQLESSKTFLRWLTTAKKISSQDVVYQVGTKWLWRRRE